MTSWALFTVIVVAYWLIGAIFRSLVAYKYGCLKAQIPKLEYDFSKDYFDALINRKEFDLAREKASRYNVYNCFIAQVFWPFSITIFIVVRVIQFFTSRPSFFDWVEKLGEKNGCP